MKKNEKNLREIINKIIKEGYLEEISFKDITSRISNFFSKKPSHASVAPTRTKTTSKTQKDSLERGEIRKFNTINFGKNIVDVNKVDVRFLEAVFEKNNGKIERKRIPSLDWLFDDSAKFDVEKIDISKNFDKNNIKSKDVIFYGNWKEGEFKGVFQGGVFEGGYIKGGNYRGKSLNFLPNKTIKEKLNAFKSGFWFSLGGLFGLKYVTPPAKSKSYNMLEILEGDYIDLTISAEEKYRILVLAQPFGDINNVRFNYVVEKIITKREIISGSTTGNINNPAQKQKYKKVYDKEKKSYKGKFKDIKNNIIQSPEGNSLYDISIGKNKNFFFANQLSIKYIKIVRGE